MNPRHTWLWLFLAAALFGLVFAQHRYLRRHPPGPSKVLTNLKPSAVASIQVQLRGPLEIALGEVVEVRADGATSIRRAWTPAEFAAIARSAGVSFHHSVSPIYADQTLDIRY